MIARTTVNTPTWKFIEYPGGDVVVETCASWTRYHGKNHYTSQSREGTIHTRSRFRAWAKRAAAKHMMFQMPTEEEINRLPVKCDHGYT